MKYGRSILYVVGVLFSLLLLFIYGGALFMPSSYEVERSITIQRPPETVYKKVADLREWRKWNPWSQGSDTNVYRGPKTGKGAVWEWRSKEHGNGELRIVEAEPYKRIETRITFRDSSLTGHGKWQFERRGDDTKVSWGTTGKLGYPFGRIFAWIRDPQDLIGGDLQKGLKILERHLEEDVPMSAAR
jgi:uncharacterized protein YndB with AHSA1/START domain